MGERDAEALWTNCGAEGVRRFRKFFSAIRSGICLQIFFWCDKSNAPFAAHRKKKYKSGRLRRTLNKARSGMFLGCSKTVKMAK
jgi:hypothetical protein